MSLDKDFPGITTTSLFSEIEYSEWDEITRSANLDWDKIARSKILCSFISEEDNLEVESLLDKYPGILLREIPEHNGFNIIDNNNNIEIDMCFSNPRHTSDQSAWMPSILTQKGKISFITEQGDQYLSLINIISNSGRILIEEEITDNELFDSLFLARAVSGMLLYFDSLSTNVKDRLPDDIKHRNIARQNLNAYQRRSLIFIFRTIDKIFKE